ncbi:MAG TPA: M15 family metallopeptidase [Nocardioides sp.]
MGAWGGPRRGRVAATLLCAALVLAACGGDGKDGKDVADPKPSESIGAETSPGATPTIPVAEPERSVKPPGPLKGRLWPADILIYSQDPLTDYQVKRIEGLKGVGAADVLSMSQVSVENKVLSIAAVDPSTYRRFNPVATAQAQEIWDRVAGGEVALPPDLAKSIKDKDDYVKLGNDKSAPRVHIGVYAEQIPKVDLVINKAWAEELKMAEGNAMLVSTGINSPQSMRSALRRILGGGVSIQDLDAVARYGLDPDAQQTAILTGGSVAKAVGSFSYTVLEGGRIAPDSAWVSANIRTEEVPILGRVTCHKVMIPQLRAALTEVVTRGLADKINPGEYAGCYYPRFIANTQQLSLHSFGIALDMNTPGNQRGTVGEMDRTVVDIFKKWGFGWGGDWSFTDPMHFEMNALVKAG